MNCPECGHPMKDHRQEHELVVCDTCERTVKPYAYCSISFAEVERDAWKAEAMAAREYISELETGVSYSGFSYSEWPEYNAYLAARVKDNELTTKEK